MDTTFDLNYLILIPTVLVSGLVLFVCGFKKPVEPPLFELADERQKKKQKTKDTRQATVSISFLTQISILSNHQSLGILSLP
jgi:hypothetical protein